MSTGTNGIWPPPAARGVSTTLSAVAAVAAGMGNTRVAAAPAAGAVVAARLVERRGAGPMIELGRGLAAALPAAALLGVLALGAPAPTAGQAPVDGRGEGRGEAVPSLVVEGHGEARAAPDEATVRLGV